MGEDAGAKMLLVGGAYSISMALRRCCWWAVPTLLHLDGIEKMLLVGGAHPTFSCYNNGGTR